MENGNRKVILVAMLAGAMTLSFAAQAGTYFSQGKRMTLASAGVDLSAKKNKPKKTKPPAELGGCNSRCTKKYCQDSSGKTYLCRCDCPKSSGMSEGEMGGTEASEWEI